MGPVPVVVKTEKLEAKVADKSAGRSGVLRRMFWGGLWVGSLTGLVSLGAT